MSLRNQPPALTVLHGYSCKNRYLTLGPGPTKNPYRIAFMVLSADEREFGGLWTKLKDRALGAVIEDGTRWDFPHRESSCKGL